MSGNTFGKHFAITSFGEAHGVAIGCIVDGCPAGLSLSIEDIQQELDRRKPGSHYTSQRREPDQVEILSGLFEGKTTGSPIALLIRNTDTRPKDYDSLKSVFRPGHGDYTYFHKYGLRDHRGGGRASARETAVRVAAGAIAKKFLREANGITIRGYLAQMDDIAIEQQHFSWDSILENPFFCPDATKVPLMEQKIEHLRKLGDSCGARVDVVAQNVPCGLGEPVYDKLDADLAKALMSINAVKGVEIGDGFQVVQQKGSEHRDEITPTGFLSNHAGGILAGISTGQPLRVSLALKPASSIRIPGRSVNEKNEAVEVVTLGRHDPCVGIRAVPVAEAMVALVLIDHWLCVFGQRRRT